MVLVDLKYGHSGQYQSDLKGFRPTTKQGAEERGLKVRSVLTSVPEDGACR